MMIAGFGSVPRCIDEEGIGRTPVVREINLQNFRVVFQDFTKSFVLV